MNRSNETGACAASNVLKRAAWRIRRVGSVLGAGPFGLAVALHAEPARAGCTFHPGSGEQMITVQVPASLTFSRDLANGTPLYTSPAATTASDTVVTCTTSSPGGVTDIVGPQPGLGATIFPIWRNGVDTGLSFQWIGSGTPSTSYGTASFSGLLGTQKSTPRALRIIKTGTVQPGVVLPAGTMIAYSAIGGLRLTDMVLGGNLVATVSSCATPSFTVPLGTHLASEFTRAGATTTAVSFNINLNNCPKGMAGVHYRIDPTTSVVNAAQAVVALDANALATGVGVQLLNGAGSPFALSTDTTFSGYSSGTGGTYAIPLQARYYQTGTSVGPGPASTSMTFTMTYL